MNNETADEMLACWHHEREDREQWISERADAINATDAELSRDAAIAIATNEYWNGDMPESVEKEIGR